MARQLSKNIADQFVEIIQGRIKYGLVHFTVETTPVCFLKK